MYARVLVLETEASKRYEYTAFFKLRSNLVPSSMSCSNSMKDWSEVRGPKRDVTCRVVLPLLFPAREGLPLLYRARRVAESTPLSLVPPPCSKAVSSPRLSASFAAQSLRTPSNFFSSSYLHPWLCLRRKSLRQAKPLLSPLQKPQQPTQHGQK